MRLISIIFLLLTVALSGCGGGGGGGGGSAGTAPVTGTLNGVAAVGTPIVGGTISVFCAQGNAIAAVTTDSNGAWSVNLTGQTLPCAVQVTGGTINGASNNTAYHSIAITTGTVNVTPLTDLIVANLTGTTPRTWFASLSSTPASLGISQNQVDTALANLIAALPALPLGTVNPITTPFTAISGNVTDDMLTALAAAIANNTVGVNYASLLGNLSASTTPVSGFAAALTTAYTGTTSGGGGGVSSYTIGGTVIGLTGSLELQDNNGDNLSVSSNGSFVFATPVSNGGLYNVTVVTQPYGKTCTASSNAGTVSGSNVSNVAVTCSTNSYTVGGSATGLTGTLILQDNSGDNLMVAASGSFTFARPVASGSHYNVSVLSSPSGQSCSVTNSSGTMAVANVSNVVVSCATNTYTIGGAVTGLTGTLVLQNNGGDNRSVSSNGNFTFASSIANGALYSVTILSQPSGQTCTASSNAGTASGSNVNNVAVTCASNSYAVGGSATGLTGTLVLQDNNGDNLTIVSSGSFAFASKVANGSPYNVSVFSSPGGQSCAVANSSGTMGLANVTNVTVSCATNTYTIGGSVSGLTGSLVLQDNGADRHTVSSNGNFTFSATVANGNPYNVAVLTQPTGQNCSVTGGSGTASANVSNVSVVCTNLLSTLTLSLPARSINPANLAVIVAANDPLSPSIASYYQTVRGIPAANIISVNLPAVGVDTISDTDFATLKAAIDAKLPGGIQATLLTWTQPSRVVGSCAMSITSAMALGFNAAYCANGCAATTASSYYNSESASPWTSYGVRPSMMLGATTLSAAQALINLGVSADATYPPGDGYLMRTSDVARSVRYSDYLNLPALWTGNSGIALNYIDNSAGAASDSILSKSGVLFYFTGLATVPDITSNSYRPGAIADSLTSYGGYLPGGNGQMPVTSWLVAGVTASYGTVDEPCNYPQKFSQASVLIDQYYRGATLIEAYWKSVQWPGQGLFVGEPLAQPFRDNPSFTISGSQYVIKTRAMRANSNYSLQYLSPASVNWQTLANYTVTRAQPKILYAPLPPASATQIRWVGPCPANAAQQCTLSTSP